MLDKLSPLKLSQKEGRYGASGNAGVLLGSRALRGLWQIAGWEDFETSVAPLLQTHELADGGTYRRAVRSKQRTSFRIAPDRILIECSDDLEQFASDQLMVLDLGHARTVITLEGHAARDILSQLIAIDFSPSVFAPGEFVQTGIHHVGVLIHCTGENSFDIQVPVTWAVSIWDVIFDNALPHGLTVMEAA